MVIDTLPVNFEPMSSLQNRWYNGLTSGLQQEPSLFQISQPTPPLSEDSELWSYLNVIPPASLTFNHALYSATPFFDKYAAVINQLNFPIPQFKQDIGTSVYSKWVAYVNQIQPPPGLNQLPALFREWASRRGAISVASKGATDLAQMAFIAGWQQALQPYLGSHPLPANYTITHQDLLIMLASSVSCKVVFDSKSISSDVKNTWTKGKNDNFYGLWAGTSPTSRLSRRFAAGQVSVSANFKAFSVLGIQPGNWYNSAALGIAYNSPTIPPWSSVNDPGWNDMFGPSGAMLYAVVSLVVADEAKIDVICSSVFNPSDQVTILQNGWKGLWPFFIPSSDVASNEVRFDHQTGMAITTTTQPNNPLVIGANVLGISQYLGHLS